MLHGDLGGVFNLPRRAAKHFGEPRRRHRTGRSNLALAADFGAADRGVFLEQNANRRGGEQKAHDAVIAGAGHEARVVVQHRGNDPRRAVGGGGDHPSAGGVFLVHGERVQRNPVEHRQRIGQRRFGLGEQLPVQLRRPPGDFQATG